MELAVSSARLDAFAWLSDATSDRAVREAHWLNVHGDPTLARWLAEFSPTHIYFGSEFCEHLLPSAHALRKALEVARGRGLGFALLTPVASPEVLRRIGALLPLLPDGSEIVVNDWGVAAFVAEQFPSLRAIAGRVLCRMVKDPRLDAAWAHHCGLGLDSPFLQRVMRNLGIERVEIDMPLFADQIVLGRVPFLQGVHLPYFCVAKGRMCRIGSMSLEGPGKFAAGHRCKKECLDLVSETCRPGAQDGWPTFQVGNSIFGRHSPRTIDALIAAVEDGTVPRLVLAGEAL